MAREQSSEQKQAEQDQQVAPAVEEPITTAPPTQFVAQGPIPPVETAVAAPQQTASEKAYGKGPGVQALEKLLEKGTPKAGDVASLIDSHRSEHDAMLTLVSDKLGASFADTVRSELSSVRASISRRELVAGDPGDPHSGYVVVSQAEQGAKWKTAGGGFTGTANKDGVDTKVKLDDRDTLHGHVNKDKSASLAFERDGKNEGELYGRYGSGSDYEAGARRTWDLSPDDKLTTSAGVRNGGAFGQTSYAGHHGADTVTGSITETGKGTSVDAKDVHDFGGGYSASAMIHAGPEGTTGQLAGAYADKDKNVDANVTRGLDQTSLHLGATSHLSPQQTVTGSLDHVEKDHGGSQSTLALSERYRSGEMVHGLDLSLGHGAQDYAKLTGSADAQLAPHTYGGIWGSAQVDSGHQTSAQLGASLTFTPSEKTALTAAGVIDQTGRLETRLQFDVFKSRIESVGDLEQHKKDAMVSLFLSYSKDGHRMMDDRFGSPTIDRPIGDQVTAGIKIRF